MLTGCLPDMTRSLPYHRAIANGNYKLFAGNTVITLGNWNSLRRHGMTLKLQVWPPPLPGPVVLPLTGDFPPPPHWAAFAESRKARRDIFLGVDKLLKLSRSWTPDAESFKGSGIGHLLRLWTNAVDPDDGDDSDDSSIRSWSSSGSSEIVD